MPPGSKNPKDEARFRLQEKLSDVKSKVKDIHDTVTNISQAAIAKAEEVLLLKSKSKFMGLYPKASQELEICLNQLLLISHAISSGGLNDSDGSESENEQENNEVKEERPSFEESVVQSSVVSDNEQETLMTTTLSATITDKSQLDQKPSICNNDGKVQQTSQTSFSSTTTVLSAPTKNKSQLHQKPSICENDEKMQQTSKTSISSKPGINTQDDAIKKESTQSLLTVQNVEALQNNETELLNDIESSYQKFANNIDIKAETSTQFEEDDTFIKLERHPSLDSLFSSVSQGGQTVSPSTFIEKMETTEIAKDVKVENFQWQSDAPYQVLVTDVISPWEYCLQLIDDSNSIDEQLCMQFMKEASFGYKGGLRNVPPVDCFCCAKSPVDETWYRAKVISIVNDYTARVRFIDEGYESDVAKSSLRPLNKKYTVYPSRSFRCILGGVQPTDAMKKKEALTFDNCTEYWTRESFQWVNDLADGNKNMFVAYFYFAPAWAYEPPNNISKDILVCDLYLYQPSLELNFGSIDFSRPPINTHIAFLLTVNQHAGVCSIFPSEMNRKKSQKVLEEHLQKNKAKSKNNETDTGSKTILHQPTVVKNLQVQDGSNKLIQKVSSGKETNKNLFKDTFEKTKTPNIKIKDDLKYEPFHEHNTSSVSNISTKSSQSSNLKSSSKSTKKQNVADPSKSTKSSVKYESVTSKSVNSLAKPITSPTTCHNRDQVNKKDVPYSRRGLIEKVKEKEYKFGKTLTEAALTAESEGFAKVAISEVVSPGLFYVHQIVASVAKLDELMENLNRFYQLEWESVKQKTNDFDFQVEDPVAARYSGDLKWYRAIIVNIVSENTNTNYDVLYVDYGSTERLSRHEILPLCEQFCFLPTTVIPCCLADVEPLSSIVTHPDNHLHDSIPAGNELPEYSPLVFESPSLTLTWSSKSISRVKELLPCNGNILLASLTKPERNEDGLFEIYLYDTNNKAGDVFINQQLINEGLVFSKVLLKQVDRVVITEQNLENDIKALKSQELMRGWDPMKEQYHSQRNTYTVDVDDAGVATQGYVHQGKEICYNYSRRGYCYRGKYCKYLHAHPNSVLANSIDVLGFAKITELPEIGDWVAVTVTAMMDPTHFWVRFPYGLSLFKFASETNDTDIKRKSDLNLEKLQEFMNEYYSYGNHNKKTDLTCYAEGQLVAVKYWKTKCWYRASVTKQAEDFVQVIYVDYGNTDIVHEANIRELIDDFCHLPYQAVECFLDGVRFDYESVEKDGFKDSMNQFCKLTGDKALVALVKSRSMSKILYLEVYDTSVSPSICVNHLLKQWKGITAAPPIVNKKEQFEDAINVKRERGIPG